MATPNVSSSENKLPSRLANEIEEFWQTGIFSSFHGVDNTRINYASFISPNNVNCLVISPGRSESYIKYKELIFDLALLNVNIFILDHRGQGFSERLLRNSHKGYVKQFDDYADDLHTFIKDIVHSSCASDHKPLLLAHSMGGNIAIRLMQKYPDTIKSALFSAPMIAINKGGLPDWLAIALANTGTFINHIFSNQAWYFFGQTNYKASVFDNNPLTHSAVRYQIFVDLYQSIPQIQLGGVTTQWLQQAFKAKEHIFSQLDRLSAPIFIMQAGADTIVDNTMQDDFASNYLTLITAFAAKESR